MKYTPYQWSSALGCMLGQACGDALGTTLEFKSADKCQELYPQGLRDIVGGGAFNVEPGQVTDDTEMAMALARSASLRHNVIDAIGIGLHHVGRFDPRRVYPGAT